MLPALLGAFATIASGGLGAMASNNAAAYNYNSDVLNYNQREQERFDTINAARRQDADTKLGSTDAAGNRTYFVPGRGWVVELAEDQQALQDLYQREELAQLSNDLPKKRDILNANVERQGRESGIASQLLDAFQRTQMEDPRELENQLNNASVRGITQGFDSALQDAMQSAVRTGASNAGNVAADIGKARASALMDAFMNNKINAKGQAKDNYSREQGNTSNLYNMYASRASAMPDVAYNPRNIEGQTGQQQQASMQANQGAQGALINAFAKQGGSMPRIEPNYGVANAVQSGGNALASAFDAIAADRQRTKAMQTYGGYAGLDPKMFQQGTGLW